MKPVCLSIAGSDSSGGAGIQADIKSIQANGAYAATAITAITAQNTIGVQSAYELPPHVISAQIESVCSDLHVAAAKTGMLSSGTIVQAVADAVQKHNLAPLVVDPVMISKSGYALLADDAVKALIDMLLPLAYVVTPNAHEAARLAGMEVKTLDDAKEAAVRIRKLGPENVLVKGGHLASDDTSIDVLFDGTRFESYSAPRIETKNTHGTGCTYSAAIAAQLAHGLPLVDAIAKAKRYVTDAIRHGMSLGSGHGPTDHFYFIDWR